MNPIECESRILIDDLDISVRLSLIFRAANIEYLHQIITYSANDLLKFRNFGNKCLKEVRDVLKKHNLCLLGEEATLELRKLLLMDVPDILNGIRKQICELQCRMNVLHVHLDAAINQSKKPYE